MRSGHKYRTVQGFTAIKDGVKARTPTDTSQLFGKPRWLKAPPAVGPGYEFVRQTVHRHRLATVCEEAKCPNIGECWNAGTATLMLMGAVCTRACRFCAVDTGNPHGWLDVDEPKNVAASVALMHLKYVVLTSVNRDDLPDGGASHYAACIRAIKQHDASIAVEALTPDFQGVLRDVECVVDAGADVFAQNIETVRRLTHEVRDPRADYDQTLAVLAHAKCHRPELITKSSLMLGLGESEAEIAQTMADLRASNVDILTLGQYLRPTVNHLPVARYVSPQEFERYRGWGLTLGFLRMRLRSAGALRAIAPSERWSATTSGLSSEARADTKASSAQPCSARDEPGRGAEGQVQVRWLGLRPYESTWRAMQRLTEERTADTADQVWLLELRSGIHARNERRSRPPAHRR